MSPRRTLPRLAAAVLTVAALALSGCSGGSDDDSHYRFDGATPIGTLIPKADRLPAADVTGPSLLGAGRQRLAAGKGRATVVAFWGSWCPPCRVEMPQLQTLHEQYASKGVSFVGVDSLDDKDNARAFLTNNKIDFPSIYDPRGEVVLKLGNIPGNMPFTVLLDRAGKVAAVYTVRYAPKDLTRALSSLRAES
ncbi:Thiol-disulfide isomerase or thioredoxin [Jatrophihabitans endophyticus]|uniref:Thiol-disulfide isomerase or thioredoxin n=1 Tax=Jatrophihabitans endophyticus TaxID=1206085 RepID=A0A1M5QZU5_9ACTN|nr:TlpA disulfide reductase family protein [Jatrophihabitans endophyticus]SHH19249.1 Thiol-disulfide isomerase or thioredoxin [Jatrophihabitans endophyticus]